MAERTSWNKGKKRPPFSKEWRENMRIAHLGKPSGMSGKSHSAEARKKIGKTLARIGHHPPAPPRLLVSKQCVFCRKEFKRKPSWAVKQKFCSAQCYSRSRRKKFCVDCNKWLRPNVRDRCRPCWKKWSLGENSGGWKGGITAENKLARETKEYKEWRRKVFERDRYMCVIGGKRHGGKLEADHIKPFSLFPELRLAIDNGRTLCVECHHKTDTWGMRGKKKFKITNK